MIDTRKMEAPVVRTISVQNKRCWEIKLLVQSWKSVNEAIKKQMSNLCIYCYKREIL